MKSVKELRKRSNSAKPPVNPHAEQWIALNLEPIMTKVADKGKYKAEVYLGTIREVELGKYGFTIDSMVEYLRSHGYETYKTYFDDDTIITVNW